MVKAGSEAEYLFIGARNDRTVVITPQYMNELRSAVCEDFRQAGTCTLLIKLIAPQIIGQECRAIISGISDLKNSNEYSTRPEGGKAKMIEIQAGTKQLKEEKERLEKEIDARSKRLKELEAELGKYKNAESICEAAKSRKDMILNEADLRAKQIKASAAEERDSLLANARIQERQIIDDAKAYAARIVKEAEAEKERVLKEKIDVIDRIFPEYRRRIEAEHTEASEESREYRTQTGEEIVKLKNELERAGDSERNDISNSEKEMRSSIQTKFSDCIGTFKQAIDVLKNEYTKMLDEQKQSFLDQIETLSEDIQKKSIVRQNQTAANIQGWKTDLFRVEYKGLASFYRLFSASTKGAKAKEDELYADLNQRTTEGQADPAEEDPFRIELHNRNCNMIKLESQLKNALSRIGIIEYVPNIGDEFDYDLHICKSDEAFPAEGARITKVIENGMVLKRAGEEDIVLLQATVEVENDDDE